MLWLRWQQSQVDHLFPARIMPPANLPRLSLADTMILVATAGLSQSCYILLDNELFSGQRFLFGLLQPSQGWNTLEMMNYVNGTFSILLILFGGWTLVLPVLPLRKHRSQWRRLSRQPGISGCIAAIVGMVVWTAVACVTLWIRDQVEGHQGLPPRSGHGLRSSMALLSARAFQWPLCRPSRPSPRVGPRGPTGSTGSAVALVCSGSRAGLPLPRGCF